MELDTLMLGGDSMFLMTKKVLPMQNVLPLRDENSSNFTKGIT